MTTYIYILSLDRSRSTVIDKTLSSGLNGISLGEVQRVINPSESENEKLFKTLCTCNQIPEECDFWRPFVTENIIVRENNFRRFVETQERVIIDSSKTLKRLFLIKEYNIKILVIVPIRKFDEWFMSVKKALKRNSWETNIFNSQNKLSTVRLNFRRIKILAFFEYILTYFRFYLAIRKLKSSAEICVVLSSNDLEKFIHSKSNGSKQKGDVHIIRGNRSRLEAKKLQAWDDQNYLTRAIKALLQ